MGTLSSCVSANRTRYFKSKHDANPHQVFFAPKPNQTITTALSKINIKKYEVATYLLFPDVYIVISYSGDTDMICFVLFSS